MNHDEPTDAQLEQLLGTYAEALYKSSVVPDGKQDTPTTDGLAVSNTNPKANNMDTSNEQATLEVDLQPENDGGSKGRILALVGGVLLVAAVGIGAVSIIGNNDSSELDVAQDAIEEEVAEEEATDDTAATEESATPDTTVAEDEAMVDEFSSTSSFFNPFGNGSTVFTDGDFATLTNNGDGFVVMRGIGEDTTSTPAQGLPDSETAWANYVVATDSGFAALIEEFTDGTEGFDRFSEELSPDRYLATSVDMINWTTVELPALTDSGIESAYINAIATSGDQVAISGQIIPTESAELLLLEAGLITEEDMFRICSTNFDETGYTIFVCDFDEETSEENFEETPLLTIDASDPLYKEIEAVATASETPQSVMLVGPLTGPFEVVDAPVAGWDLSLAGTPDGFLAIGSSNEGASQAFASTNGLTWTEASTPASENSIFAFTTVTSNGNTILALTQTQSGFLSSTSTDLGQTWTQGSIDTALFSPYGDAVAGPAGFAVQLQGTTEAFDIGLPEEGIVLEKDGYTMTLDFFSGLGTLTGPDGVAIHEEAFIMEDELDNVIRFEGPAEENLIWLDPDTGEDLVTFTEDDFEAAYPEFTEEESSQEFTEPDLLGETWFSVDGATWTLIDSSDPGIESFGGILAVGDDEVATFNQVHTEPPAELTDFENDFEPTDEEIAALDAWYEEQGDQITYNVIPVG